MQKFICLVEDDNNRGKFGIFPDGRVYLKDHLDREVQAYHSIRVIAEDFLRDIDRFSSTHNVIAP